MDGLPSRVQVRAWLAQLANGSVSREAASDLARPWAVEREAEVEDEIVFNALARLLGADLPTLDRLYLFGPEDFRHWLAEYDEQTAGAP